LASSTEPRTRRPADTRRKVEEAAGRLFVERGYPATTMQAIADAAGVHVQTIYLAYGTKAAVLAATATRLVAGDEDPTSHPSQRRWAREIQGTTDPVRKLRLYVRHVRDVMARTAALIDVLRVAAPSDPEAAAFLAHMQAGRREGPFALLAPVAAAGQLRASVTLAAAADITYALASAETFRALIQERGWSPTRAERWVTEQLSQALLARPTDDGEPMVPRLPRNLPKTSPPGA
jgi:AcrR family transcriptional regulator